MFKKTFPRHCFMLASNRAYLLLFLGRQPWRESGRALQALPAGRGIRGSSGSESIIRFFLVSNHSKTVKSTIWL